MGLADRQARHSTMASRKVAGNWPDKDQWWFFTAGQRVMTIEGIPGEVVEVSDGPAPGNETYIVALDNDLGGGEYSASELSATEANTPLLAKKATLAGPEEDEGDDLDVQSKLVEAEHHLASEDYPELAEILVERPPLGDVKLSSLQAQANLSLEDLISVAENVMENAGEQGQLFTNNADASAWITPIGASEGVESNSDRPGIQVNMGSPYYDGGDDGGQAYVTGLGYIMVKDHSCHALTLLHELAHLINRNKGGDGHDQSFVEIATRLYAQHLSPSAADTFTGIVNKTANKKIFQGEPVKLSKKADLEAEGGFWNRVLDGPADRVNDKLPADVKGDSNGTMWSYDWCRFRKSRHCMYPEQLDQAATQIAGYQVWIPEDRGICVRDKWEDQKTCPVAEPGPHSGEPNALVDATVPWNEGGQHGGVPTVTAGRKVAVNGENEIPAPMGTESIPSGAVRLFHYTTTPDVANSIRQQGLRMSNAQGEQSQEPNAIWGSSNQAAYEDMADYKIIVEYWVDFRKAIETGAIGAPGPSSSISAQEFMGRGGDLAVFFDIPVNQIIAIHEPWMYHYRFMKERNMEQEVKAGQYDHLLNDPAYGPAVRYMKTHGSKTPVASLISQAVAAEQEFRFHFIANWSDVRAKAKKIRSNGGVRIIRAPGRAGGTDSLYITAEVQGDTNVYQTTLMRSVGNKTIASWECGCAWAAYSWGRSGRWKKYEGRMCSHALATAYEAQSQEMFGGELKEQTNTPPWRLDPTAQPVQQYEKKSSYAIPDDQLVYIAEGAMRNDGLEGQVFNDEDSASRWLTPISSLFDVHDKEYGGVPKHTVNITPNLAAYGNGDAYGTNSPSGAITVAQGHCNALTLLHELAHVITRGDGHGTEFQRTAADLYGEHISPQAKEVFLGLVNVDGHISSLRTVATDSELAVAPIIHIARGMLEDGEMATGVLAFLVESGMANPVEAMTQVFAVNDTFKVKDGNTGLVREVTMDGSNVVDIETGTTIDRAFYPTYDPILGLDMADSIPHIAAGPTTETPDQIAANNQAIYLTGNPPAGSDIVREFAVTPAGGNFWADEADDISRAYRDLPILDPSAVPLWQELGELVNAQAAALRAQYQVVQYDDLDPYSTAEEMHADIDRGVYKVTSLHSHHPVWDVPTNVNFRVVHDILGHGVAQSDFSLKGEVEAYQAECNVTPEHLWPALFTEIIAQTAFVNVHHLFGEQKVGLIPLTQAEIDAHVGTIMDAPDPDYDLMHQSASLKTAENFCPVCGDDIVNGTCLECGTDNLTDESTDMAAIMLKAEDSGRVLLHQRPWDEENNPGQWEFPGGHVEDGEAPIDAAKREFEEEVGPLPDGEVVDANYDNDYALHVYKIPNEADFTVDTDAESGTAGWFNPEDAAALTDLRPETLDGTDWDMAATAELHDEEEPALPSTTSDDILDPSNRAWLNGSGSQTSQSDNHDIALAAQAALAKMAGKTFSAAEQAQIISEGEDGVTAANLADLDLSGTHYEELEQAFKAYEDEGEMLW